MPAYNEAKNIGNIVCQAKKFCSEVVVCDDGSIDETYKIASKFGAKVVQHNRNRGYGGAIKTLFKTAKEINADIMVTLDSDGQHDVMDIPKIIQPILDKKADIVIGSRFLTESSKKNVPKYRSFGLKIITKLAQKSAYNKVTDSQSGFRAYNRNAISKMELFDEGMSVSTEILHNANENYLKIIEVPINISYDVEKSSTHNSFSHGISILSSIFRFVSVKHPLSFYSLPGIGLVLISIFFMGMALELFSETRFVSTNMVLISIGTAIIGIVLMATGVILYTMTELIRENIRNR